MQLNYKNLKDISLFKIWGVFVQKVEKRDDVVAINEIEKKKKKNEMCLFRTKKKNLLYQRFGL